MNCAGKEQVSNANQNSTQSKSVEKEKLSEFYMNTCGGYLDKYLLKKFINKKSSMLETQERLYKKRKKKICQCAADRIEKNNGGTITEEKRAQIIMGAQGELSLAICIQKPKNSVAPAFLPFKNSYGWLCTSTFTRVLASRAKDKSGMKASIALSLMTCGCITSHLVKSQPGPLSPPALHPPSKPTAPSWPA